VIAYRVPAFRVQGKTIAGFAAFKNHLSYLPFSGSAIVRSLFVSPALKALDRIAHDRHVCLC
jgi:hypothetical protein